jgi:hypothetical protein
MMLKSTSFCSLNQTIDQGATGRSDELLDQLVSGVVATSGFVWPA